MTKKGRRAEATSQAREQENITQGREGFMQVRSLCYYVGTIF